MIEARTTVLSPYCEANVRMARQMYNHCPDCGGHTRIMVVRGSAPEGASVQGPPQALIFFCDRCALAFLAVFDSAHVVPIEQGLPQLLEAAGILVKKW